MLRTRMAKSHTLHKLVRVIVFTAVAVIFDCHAAFGQMVKGNGYKTGLLQENIESGTSPTDDYIGLYQKYISNARGSRCAMYPSCSNYGLMTFNDESFVVAMAMTADRMIRCGHDGQYYDLTYEYGYPSLIDFPASYHVDPHIVYKSKGYVTTDSKKATCKEDSIIGFIHYLINQHNYQLALLEIERVYYFKPMYNNSSLFLQKLLCYDGLDREEEGLAAYFDLTDSVIRSDASVLIQVAKMYGELGNYKKEIEALSIVNTTSKDTLYSCSIRKAASSLRLGEDNDASSYIEESHIFAPSTERYQQNIEIMQGLKATKKKSPLKAGLLSIIPGGGYVYNKQPASALTAFLINGILAFATASSIHKENYGVATVMGIFNLTFYAGNILGSVNGARKYNKKRAEDAARLLEKANYIY